MTHQGKGREDSVGVREEEKKRRREGEREGGRKDRLTEGSFPLGFPDTAEGIPDGGPAQPTTQAITGRKSQSQAQTRSLAQQPNNDIEDSNSPPLVPIAPLGLPIPLPVPLLPSPPPLPTPALTVCLASSSSLSRAFLSRSRAAASSRSMRSRRAACSASRREVRWAWWAWVSWEARAKEGWGLARDEREKGGGGGRDGTGREGRGLNGRFIGESSSGGSKGR